MCRSARPETTVSRLSSLVVSQALAIRVEDAAEQEMRPSCFQSAVELSESWLFEGMGTSRGQCGGGMTTVNAKPVGPMYVLRYLPRYLPTLIGTY